MIDINNYVGYVNLALSGLIIAGCLYLGNKYKKEDIVEQREADIEGREYEQFITRANQNTAELEGDLTRTLKELDEVNSRIDESIKRLEQRVQQ